MTSGIAGGRIFEGGLVVIRDDGRFYPQRPTRDIEMVVGYAAHGADAGERVVVVVPEIADEVPPPSEPLTAKEWLAVAVVGTIGLVAWGIRTAGEVLDRVFGEGEP